MIIAPLLLAAGSAVAAPANAPPPTVVVITPAKDDAKLDPAAVAAARELLVSSGAEKQVVAMSQKASYTMIDAVVARERSRSGVDLPDDFKAGLKAVVDRHLAKYGGELTAAVIDNGSRIYARYFTADEIRELQRLQSDPVMIKFRGLAPEIMGAFMDVGVAAASVHQDELEAELKAAAERWAAQHAEQASPRRS